MFGLHLSDHFRAVLLDLGQHTIDEKVLYVGTKIKDDCFHVHQVTPLPGNSVKSPEGRPQFLPDWSAEESIAQSFKDQRLNIVTLHNHPPFASSMFIQLLNNQKKVIRPFDLSDEDRQIFDAAFDRNKTTFHFLLQQSASASSQPTSWLNPPEYFIGQKKILAFHVAGIQCDLALFQRVSQSRYEPTDLTISTRSREESTHTQQSF